MTKTMSIRMDRENLKFLNELTKEQKATFRKPCGTWSRGAESCLLWSDTRKAKHRSEELRNWPESRWAR